MRLGTKARELSKFRKYRSTTVARQASRHKTGAGALHLFFPTAGWASAFAICGDFKFR